MGQDIFKKGARHYVFFLCILPADFQSFTELIFETHHVSVARYSIFTERFLSHTYVKPSTTGK